MRRFLISAFVAIFMASVTGCQVSRSESGDVDTALDIGPIIGLIGMIVDGDDKDDYEHLLNGDDCHCHD